VESVTLARLAPAFTIGLLATLNPCVLPLYPGYLAYLAANGQYNVRHLGLMVLTGVMTMMLVLGALIAALTGALAEWSAIILQPLGVAMMFLMGLLLLLNVNPFARLSVLSSPTAGASPHARAFLYGLLFGPMIMPCAGPLVISIFTLSLGVLGFLEQLLFFLIFGLGFGMPLLALSFLPKARSERMLRQFTQHSRIVGIFSGLALIVFGIWNLRASWELLSLIL
jgi:cytochrome c-type biogenesis protein